MSLIKDNRADDPIFLILQLCADANLRETVHMLEQESGYFFSLEYFKSLILNGKWEEVQKYLSSFTSVKDNKYSTRIYFDILKQKYYEALYKNEHAVALDILRKDLRVFEESNRELYREMTLLLTIENFREHKKFSFEGDFSTLRKELIKELRPIIEMNPVFKGRTEFPQINKTTLNTLIKDGTDDPHCHLQLRIGLPLTDHRKGPGPEISSSMGEQQVTGNLSSQINKSWSQLLRYLPATDS
ncbi:hypothetical protein BUALT_Bualt05G0003100 [Buddleja alternifolia]|uniref:CTLH domain-containing protein n=1 Tax=Buddleja alternifolia TaxID=168488 RepID=A0AAV6XF52_9LAMI|nr:hypothetical protein BUALT_Bualt05G0003100 [Buddleja alternifolia]